MQIVSDIFSCVLLQVNTGEDEHSKLATDFTAHEISFFKKAVSLTYRNTCVSV